MSKAAVIAGSSGLVGGALLLQLCASKAFHQVILLVRRPSGFIHAKVKEVIVDFDRIEQYADAIKGDVFFSCLGSTRKKTPDKRRYYQIDHDYPLAMARIAQANGIAQFHLISAIGAGVQASNFYLKMKGETDRDIAALPFQAVHIYRPSFLDGPREERRFSERIGLALFSVLQPLMRGSLRKYRSIDVKHVAAAMVRQSLDSAPGVHYYTTEVIERIAASAG
ncbi:NAD(P)H-binding protein [Taibaiella koreensis]|uniref:NAD(P)H-binding protein n=1 Tax=Taibaiella koreensis TaxID=1268548 RepID=UPI000E59D8DE|nr:NAD(P)H-binding protein [Taibaiella koreensis]